MTEFNINFLPDDVRALAKTNRERLTPREVQVANCVSHGLTLQETADKLDIGYQTALTHKKNIYYKLGVTRKGLMVLFTAVAANSECFQLHTQSERMVIDRLAQGMTDKEVAGHVGIGLETVRSHIKRSLSKSGMTGVPKMLATYAATFIGRDAQRNFVAYGVVPPRACKRFAKMGTTPTPQQATTARLLAQGLTVHEIAAAVHLKRNAIDAQIKQLCMKLDVETPHAIAALFAAPPPAPLHVDFPSRPVLEKLAILPDFTK